MFSVWTLSLWKHTDNTVVIMWSASEQGKLWEFVCEGDYTSQLAAGLDFSPHLSIKLQYLYSVVQTVLLSWRNTSTYTPHTPCNSHSSWSRASVSLMLSWLFSCISSEHLHRLWTGHGVLLEHPFYRHCHTTFQPNHYIISIYGREIEPCIVRGRPVLHLWCYSTCTSSS